MHNSDLSAFGIRMIQSVRERTIDARHALNGSACCRAERSPHSRCVGSTVCIRAGLLRYIAALHLSQGQGFEQRAGTPFLRAGFLRPPTARLARSSNTTTSARSCGRSK